MTLSLPCHLISTPSGRFVFVGRVPSDLACEASSPDYIEAARQCGPAIAARIAAREGGTFRSLSWETEADAYAYAAALGYAVPAPVAMVAQPVQQAQTQAVPNLNAVNVEARKVRDGLRIVGRLGGAGEAYHVEEVREGRCISDRGSWPSYSEALAALSAISDPHAPFKAAPAMVPQPCQQQQGRARAPKPARGERRYVTVRDTETGEVHRVLTSVARVGVAVVIFTPSNRHRDGALGGMLITHDDIRKAWVFNDEAEARRCLSSNRAPGERVIRAELISDPAAA